MRPDPPQHRLQGRVVVKPVTSLLVRGPECIRDPLVRDGGEFLCNPDRQRDARALEASRGTSYVSERGVGLAQGLQVTVVRLAALEEGPAPLDPRDGGGGAQEDLLGLEAAGAGVGDDSFPSRFSKWTREVGKLGGWGC